MEINGQKTLYRLSFFANVNCDFSRSKFFSNDILYDNKETNISRKIGVETKWKSPIDISLYYETMRNIAKNSLSNTNFAIDQYHLDFSATLWRSISLSFKKQMIINKYDSQVRNKMYLGDFAPSYTSKSKNYEIGAKVNNLYNNKTILANNIGDLFYTSTTTHILPRMGLLYAKFKF